MAPDKFSLDQLIADLAQAVTEASAQEVPALLGHLEQLKATLWTRLLGAASLDGKSQGAEGDTLLKIDDAAKRLNLTEDYLYRHHKRFPFTVRIGRRLRFSSNGIEKYIRQRQGR